MAVVIPLKLVYTPADATVTAIHDYQVPSTKDRPFKALSVVPNMWEPVRRGGPLTLCVCACVCTERERERGRERERERERDRAVGAMDDAAPPHRLPS